MSLVALQPCGEGSASKHWTDTIENPVALDRIIPFVSDSEMDEIFNLYPDGTAPIWGVTPGKIDQNHTKWNRLEVGDVTLFSRKGGIFASAIVTKKLRSAELAFDLWKNNDEGQTWEYIYFVDEVRNQFIPYENFNSVVGYKPTYIIQGFNVLDEEKSARLLAAFDLHSDMHLPDVPETEYQDAILELEDLDASREVRVRREQAFLRNQLFGGKREAECSICGKCYPVSFLVTAHIKKRALCTEEEKRDYRNIVVPMCVFGCDALFEKGYVVVDGGKVAGRSGSPTTKEVEVYVSLVDGQPTC